VAEGRQNRKWLMQFKHKDAIPVTALLIYSKIIRFNQSINSLFQAHIAHKNTKIRYCNGKKQESLAAVRARAVPVRPLAGEKIYNKSTQGTYM